MKKYMILTVLALIATSLFAQEANDDNIAVNGDSIQEPAPQKKDTIRGWNFEIGGGLGVGRFEYHQGGTFVSPHAENQVRLTGTVGVGINYYFVPWMGLGVGAQFTTYANKAQVRKPWVETTYDRYGQTPFSEYTITTTPKGLYENQDLFMVEVPIAFKFRACPGKVGFTATAGMKLGFPVYNKYKLASGGVMENQVYYPLFDLTMQNIPNVVENVTIDAAEGALDKTAYKKINYGLYAEIGMLFRLNKHVDLALAAYMNYYVNDVLSHERPNGQRIQPADVPDLGFADGRTTGEYPLPYTEAYNGVLRTNEVQTLHPWNVGLKLALQFNTGRKKKAPKEEKIEEQPRDTTPRDTTPVIVEPIVIDTVPEIQEDTVPQDSMSYEEAIDYIVAFAREHGIDICEEVCVPILYVVHDTVYMNVSRSSAGEELNEELQSAVIYFNLDKAVPILEPRDILDRIADVLRRHPDQKIHVNGHACKLGKPAYNQRLALRRANAVANRLRALGVSEQQLLVASLGADMPYRYTGTHQLSKDRRVEIVPTYRATEIVRPGSRLAQIARRHFGIPEFWVFIYEANKDKITNPNAVEPGTELIIPDLSIRLKGMTQQQAMNEAARLKKEIFKK